MRTRTGLAAPRIFVRCCGALTALLFVFALLARSDEVRLFEETHVQLE
jgi:hypothetical protein